MRSDTPTLLLAGILLGILLVAATITSCTDSTEPTVQVTKVEVTRKQTPAPDAALTAATILHVPWKRLEFRVVSRGVHRMEFEMNTEETLEYHYSLCCGLGGGGDGPIGAITDLVQSFTGSLDIRLAITGPSGDVLWSARTASYNDSTTTGPPGIYTLEFDNSYSQSTDKSISLDYRVLPKGVKWATPLAPTPEATQWPLHFAVRWIEDPALIQALVDAGADVDVKNADGDTPLHAARSNRNLAVIQALLDAGADVNAKNADGDTLLHVVIEYNTNPAVIQALVDAGADVDAKNDDGDTPLHSAGSNENLAVIQALVDAGADVDAKNDDGDTPLHSAGSNENLAVIQALVDAGADVDAKNADGVTPLHAAGSNENLAVIQALMDAGADVDAKDNYGNTPLHGAAGWNNNPAVIQALVDAGGRCPCEEGHWPYAAASCG